jgi:hypothetical protein
MKNFIILTIVVLLIAQVMFAAIPVVKVPAVEPNETLEFYEDSDGLFSIKVMDYYKMALMLETQLFMLGIEPKTKTASPTYEELDELDAQIIKKYL